MFYMWLFIIILLSIIEAMTVNLVSIWFIISGIFALITSFVFDNFLIQFSIFVVLGVLLMIFTRKTLEEKLTIMSNVFKKCLLELGFKQKYRESLV